MWKKIPGYSKYKINEKGQVVNTVTQKYLAGDINNAGYYRVTIQQDKKKKRFFRHKLVAELFIPNPNNLTEVNHIDGNKSNNSADNLEWCNRTYNEHEARRRGLKKYKPFVVVFVSGKSKKYEFTPQLAKELGVTRRTVLNYLQGKSLGYTKKGITSIRYL